MSKYECRKDNGKIIDPDNRIIARTTDADFFLITNRNAPKGTSRFEIRSKGAVALSLSDDNPDSLVKDLKAWARLNNRCLLTYFTCKPKAQSAKKAHY